MSNESSANKILDAVKDSGEHYASSLPMIASENILSPLVAKAVASDLHGRYAEGLPGKRYYQGCDDFDTIESLGIESAKRVFNCNFVNIQSISGTVSNIAALKALSKPGDSITAVSTADGGHISHANMGAVGVRGLDLHTYAWDEDRMEPDIDASADLIREVEPSVALFGQSVFLFPTPLQELADAAHEVGASVMYDAAHVLGLVAGGVFQDPLREGADVMTGSSHKTFPGPQGGFLISDSDQEKFQRKLNNSVFPERAPPTTCITSLGRSALSEFEEFGRLRTGYVSNVGSLSPWLLVASTCWQRTGYTASHQVLTRHGRLTLALARGPLGPLRTPVSSPT